MDVRRQTAPLAGVSDDSDASARALTPAAQRALAEAEARRRAAASAAAASTRGREVGGRDGPEPVRYGDWEKGGIAWDF
ncbi:MAG: DUF1674 domain-containing protein [Hyphomicrobiaceae bacterium]|nr:DUF1674 domain-containing protein [Hyphomicrobiaceae bacterium]